MARALREDYETKAPPLARFTGFYVNDQTLVEVRNLVKALQAAGEVAILHYDAEAGLVGLYTVPKHSVR